MPPPSTSSSSSPRRVGGLPEARCGSSSWRARPVSMSSVSTLFETGVGIAVALHLAATVPDERAHGLGTAGLLASDLLDLPARDRRRSDGRAGRRGPGGRARRGRGRALSGASAPRSRVVRHDAHGARLARSLSGAHTGGLAVQGVTYAWTLAELEPGSRYGRRGTLRDGRPRWDARRQRCWPTMHRPWRSCQPRVEARSPRAPKSTGGNRRARGAAPAGRVRRSSSTTAARGRRRRARRLMARGPLALETVLRRRPRGGPDASVVTRRRPGRPGRHLVHLRDDGPATSGRPQPRQSRRQRRRLGDRPGPATDGPLARLPAPLPCGWPRHHRARGALGRPSGGPAALQPGRVAERIEAGVSHLSVVAGQLEPLVDVRRPSAAGHPAGDPRRRRPDPGPLVARARSAGFPVLTTYGMTETASGIAGRPGPGDPR